MRTNNTTQHRKLKIKQNEPHRKPRVHSGAPEGVAVTVNTLHPLCDSCYKRGYWRQIFRNG